MNDYVNSGGIDQICQTYAVVLSVKHARASVPNRVVTVRSITGISVLPVVGYARDNGYVTCDDL